MTTQTTVKLSTPAEGKNVLAKRVDLSGLSGSLEEMSDELLKKFGKDSSPRAYSESHIKRMIRRDEKRAPELDESRISEEIIEIAVELQLNDLISAANLSTIQELYFRLHAGGMGVRKIAATLRINHRTVALQLSAAQARIRAAYREGKYAGWYEVYLSEVNRRAYRNRK